MTAAATPVAEGGEAGIAADPFTEGSPADQSEAHGGDGGGQHGTGEAMEHLGGQHRAPGGPEGEHDGADADGDAGGQGGQALVVKGVDQRAAGELADHAGDGADAERGADAALGPGFGAEIDGDERAEAGLDVGDEEVMPIQAELARSERSLEGRFHFPDAGIPGGGGGTAMVTGAESGRGAGL